MRRPRRWRRRRKQPDRLTETDHAEIKAILDQKTPLEGDVYDLERDQKGRHGRIMHYNLNEEKPAA